MNDITHIYKNRVEEREDTFIRYIIYSLCGEFIETITRHTSTEIQTYRWQYYGPRGISYISFAYNKEFADCDECILLALALEAEYDYDRRDYDRRDKADAWTAANE